MKFLLSCSIFLVSLIALGQKTSFSVQLQALSIDGLGGLQSFAWAQHGGKWLLVGGRRDGLHRRQPFAAFDLPGHNDQMYVVDPLRQQYWTKSINQLPVAIRDVLKATNIQFHQEKNTLYLTGGYGFSEVESRHTTFSTLTALDVPAIIEAVMQNKELQPHIRQVADSRLQVTGGDLKKIGNQYYLVGGHKFLGSYNPTGPGHGPGFEQQYTDAVRIFQIRDDGQTLRLDSFESWNNADYFHRRDLNVVSQITPDGKEAIAVFSGVFQPSVNLPFLDCIHLSESGYARQENFLQYFNHYHCPTIPLFDSAYQEMSTLFFGGMAQYYMQGDKRMKDDNVPFVKTITKATKLTGGGMTETVMPVEMPGYLGSGAHFIPMDGLPSYPNHVFKYDSLADVQAIGFIYGGISSSAPNIFFTNDGTQSHATGNLFLVTVVKDKSSVITDISSSNVGQVRVHPNPVEHELNVDFMLHNPSNVEWKLMRSDGAMALSGTWRNLDAGVQCLVLELPNNLPGGLYYMVLSDSKKQQVAAVFVK